MTLDLSTAAPLKSLCGYTRGADLYRLTLQGPRLQVWINGDLAQQGTLSRLPSTDSIFDGDLFYFEEWALTDTVAMLDEPPVEFFEDFGITGTGPGAVLHTGGLGYWVAWDVEPAAAPLADPVQVALIGEGRGGVHLNSVQGVLATALSVNGIREGLADYEQDWARFEALDTERVRFVYASEDSTDVVGMLAYLTALGPVTLERFAFGEDRL